MSAERRFFEGSVEQANEGIIFGYAAVFDKPSQRLYDKRIGDFIEYIDKRAFDDIISDPNMLVLSNHDHNFILGRTGSGTAEVGIDSRGLWYKVTPPETRADVLESVKRGDMIGSSFSFDSDEEEWTQDESGLPKRTIRSFKKVYDVGPVSYPAYLDTTTAARNYESYKRSVEEREEATNNLSLYKMKLYFLENSIII